MTNSNTNRRESMRVKLSLDFCVTAILHPGEKHADESSCFVTKTVDVAMGGVCVSHKNILRQGDMVELRTKNCLTNTQCLSCEYAYFMSNKYEMTPVKAQVVWATPTRAGLKFVNLAVRNENILSKIVWDAHLNEVRGNREKKLISDT